MAVITTLNANDNGATSRTTINTNFTTLNSAKIETLTDLGITTTAVKINYVSNVTSDIQAQINTKQATITNLAVNLGGTGTTSYTIGDMLYASGTTTLSKLNIGPEGTVLKISGGVLTWAAVPGTGTVSSVSVVTANGISGTVATATTTPAITLTLGVITPTSVSISGATGLTLGTSSSAVGGMILKNATNANTLTINSGVTSASYVLTLPTAVASAGQVLTDAAGNGVLSWATPSVGFTNPMTTLGDIIYENVTPAATRLAGNITTAKQYLSQTGTGVISAAPAWATIAAADLSNGTIGSGNIVLATSPTLVTPTLNGLPTGTGVSSSATASTLVARDANANSSFNNIHDGFTTIATAGGTTTLTVASTHTQYFTGTLTQTVQLPDATTLTIGHDFLIHNRSTGLVTINDGAGGAVFILASGTSVLVTCTSIGTIGGNWIIQARNVTAATGKIGTFSNSLTLTGTDGSSVAFGTGGTVLYSGGALGTPSSGTATNITGLPLTTGVIGTLPFANGGTGLASWTQYLIPYAATTTSIGQIAIGTSGQVLTSNGAGVAPSFQAASFTTIPKVRITTSNYVSTGWSSAITGSASAAFTAANGMQLVTTASATDSISQQWYISDNNVGNANSKVFDGSPSMGISIGRFIMNGTTSEVYVGIGDVTVSGTAGHTWTNKHIGIRIENVGNASTWQVYATVANGTTETKTLMLTLDSATSDSNAFLEFSIQVNGSASVDFWYKKNGGARSAATNIATNVPTGDANSIPIMQFSLSNKNNAAVVSGYIHQAYYER